MDNRHIADEGLAKGAADVLEAMVQDVDSGCR